MADNLKERLAHIMERNRAAAKERKAQEPATPETAPPRPDRRQVRGRAAPAIIADAQRDLFEMERAGRFISHPLNPQSEYPRILTRLPIFIPGQQAQQKGLLDEDSALPFKSSWGQGRRHGPLLTIYDEDTFIALGRLRQKCLEGHPDRLPISVSRIAGLVTAEASGNEVQVHVVQCMLSDIHRMCGTTGGGANDKKRLNSVKKLAATTIEFDTKTADKFIGRGTNIKLLDVAWQEYARNAVLYIQFTPIVAKWFVDEYTYINWDLRRKLTDTGKAHLRFLSSQGKTYKIGTKLLMETIGYRRAYKKYMAELRHDMSQLQEEGWLTYWEITGNGRTVPHMLALTRS